MKTLDNFSIEKLSKATGLPQDALLDLAKDAPLLYHESYIPKKEKGHRKLEIPHPLLKKFQKVLLKKVLNKIPTHPCLYGRPGDSVKKAVREHVKKKVIITMDIEDFFPSTKAFMIRNAFIRNGTTKEVAKLLTRLVSRNYHLPQGAPTSPCIGRIILHPFAQEVEKIFINIPMSSFSIYVDDITISGPKDIKGFRNTIGEMLKRYGYMVNKNKTKVMDRNQDQISLGIRLNDRIEARKEFMREIEELEKKVPPSDLKLRGQKSYVEFLRRPDE